MTSIDLVILFLSHILDEFKQSWLNSIDEILKKMETGLFQSVLFETVQWW